MDKADIAVLGLGVMGYNLALNMVNHGFAVAGFDLDPVKIENIVKDPDSKNRVFGLSSLSAIQDHLQKPRRVLIMVPAGSPVDQAITGLKPYLSPQDIVIDGGNSYFQDTERRHQDLSKLGLNFVGLGVSGGKDGALHGPSLMPGGSTQAWESMSPILSAIAAKGKDGLACVTHIGPRGSGHYVKMVHNGIEYADMQLIAEVYDVLHRGLNLSAPELHKIFTEWNTGPLTSYLIGITARIFSTIDPDTGKPLVDQILDEAQQKGTGKWASQNSMDIGAAIPSINSAVESRILSSLKTQRVQASHSLKGPASKFLGDHTRLIENARDALYASKITAYAQGMAMLHSASEEYHYDLNLGEIARIWRAGCIIRAQLLDDIWHAYLDTPQLPNLLLAEPFKDAIGNCQAGWRSFIQTAVGLGIPIPGISASISYFDSYRSEVLPANLVQAQRDYFGAHTFRRKDKPGIFHVNWE